ncbi:DegV family protein [Sutcliffiella horikoshii]|uniref:DegV family protein n=1 Tax=Sutcliffiella horikoshii TaxID=79883 RepID=A0A1Y0CPB6_9BACI|nr:DegV family protein [Sutcliffiella horikoshii]ART76757.1 fatty acid-binding protein DegV [Sutcliffiella horikoshii]TYS58147.1 DegV family protein [Sutcliffiella horikoshii]
MTNVKIVTDSTVDIDQSIIEELNIEIVPLSITIDGESYIDRFGIKPDEFMDKMKHSTELPKSSQPAVGTFVDVYNRLGEDGSKILSIHMTGGMSGTVGSAESAAGISDSDVTVIDSRFISFALSFQVVAAAKMAKEGKDLQEILNKLNDVRSNTDLFIMVDTLDNLVKGGRIGRGKALIGSLLNIKPIASLADGVYTPVTKVRSQSQVIKFFTKQFKEDIAGKVVKGVGIAHAGSLKQAQVLKDALYEASGFEDIQIAYTTPVISTHTGPGAVALMYYAE